jgi:hypothetical protein
VFEDPIVPNYLFSVVAIGIPFSSLLSVLYQNLASSMRVRDILLLSAAATNTFGAPQVPERVLPQIPFEAAQQLPSKTNEKFLVELSPGETRWITEDDKWALRRVSNYTHRS